MKRKGIKKRKGGRSKNPHAVKLTLSSSYHTLLGKIVILTEVQNIRILTTKITKTSLAMRTSAISLTLSILNTNEIIEWRKFQTVTPISGRWLSLNATGNEVVTPDSTSPLKNPIHTKETQKSSLPIGTQCSTKVHNSQFTKENNTLNLHYRDQIFS